MLAGPPVTILMFPPDRPQSCCTASVPAKGFIPDPHWHRMAERGRAGKAGKARHTQTSDTKKEKEIRCGSGRKDSRLWD